MRLRISAIALVLTAGPALAQGAPDVSTDLTVDMAPQQYRICNDRPARPAWMDGLHPREAYKALTMMDLYELRAWERISETKDCSCETRFPEWGEVSVEYTERFATSSNAEHTQAQLQIRRERNDIRQGVQDICEAQGNW